MSVRSYKANLIVGPVIILIALTMWFFAVLQECRALLLSPTPFSSIAEMLSERSEDKEVKVELEGSIDLDKYRSVSEDRFYGPMKKKETKTTYFYPFFDGESPKGIFLASTTLTPDEMKERAGRIKISGVLKEMPGINPFRSGRYVRSYDPEDMDLYVSLNTFHVVQVEKGYRMLLRVLYYSIAPLLIGYVGVMILYIGIRREPV